MYKYLFGPVPSRRLGMSLGIDLVPYKVCTLNCVYCECGPTTHLTLERKEYIPGNIVLKELDQYLKNNPSPDYLTFSGSGEPTLNTRLGEVLNFIKVTYPHIPVAVLTNGTLFSDPGVRKELQRADLVLPSLDAASRECFQKINRPGHSLDINKCIQGLVKFRQEYSGKIWLEVFILPGYNDHNKELLSLKKAIKTLAPDRIQINTLDRPGSAAGLKAAGQQQLRDIMDLWDLDNVEIIAAAPKRKDIKSFRTDIETAILETISRRPCTLDDLAEILGLHINEINKYLDVLEKDEKIKAERQPRGVFYRTT